MNHRRVDIIELGQALYHGPADCTGVCVHVTTICFSFFLFRMAIAIVCLIALASVVQKRIRDDLLPCVSGGRSR